MLAPASFLPQSSPLLIQEQPLTFLPTLGAAVGESCALFLQELHNELVFSDVIAFDQKWVRCSLDEWNFKFFWWSKKTVQRVIAKLKNFDTPSGVYHIVRVENYNEDRFDSTRWYSIDYDELARLLPLAQHIVLKKRQHMLVNSPSLSSREERIKAQYPEFAAELEKFG